jgi:hypothetical protein
MTDAATHPEPAERPKPVVGRRQLALLAVPMTIFAITANVGNALAPTLIVDRPVLLLVLAPRLRWLLLASPRLDAIWFYLIPLARTGAILTTYYLLGRWYGDWAVRWLEERARNSARPLLWMERNFHRARWPVAFAFPGNLVALLAGADRIAMPLYLLVALSSMTLRLVLVRYLATVFEGPLLTVLDWVGRNQLWLTLASMGAVFAWVLWSNRHGFTPIESVEEMAEGLDQAAEDLAEEA